MNLLSGGCTAEVPSMTMDKLPMKLRLAVIEDDAIIAMYLAEALDELGYEVVAT